MNKSHRKHGITDMSRGAKSVDKDDDEDDEYVYDDKGTNHNENIDNRGGVYVSGGIIINADGGNDIWIGSITNDKMGLDHKNRYYDVVPKWRSPFTMAILTWLSVFFGAISVFSLFKSLSPVIRLIQGDFYAFDNMHPAIWAMAFAVEAFLWLLFGNLEKLQRKKFVFLFLCIRILRLMERGKD